MITDVPMPVQWFHRLAVMVLACAAVFPLGRAAAVETLGSVAEIRSLSRDDAARGLSVKLRGTVAYKARGGRTFILHDGQEGVSVHLFRAKELGIWKGGGIGNELNEVGAMIEIEGITGPAGYSPVIIPTRFKRLGTGSLPEPKRVPIERLLSGSDVSQRVLVEGVVQRSVGVDDGKWAMTLIVDGHLCDVDFQEAAGFDSVEIVDSRVEIRGFCSPVFNLRSESTRLRLLAWGKDDVTVTVPPPADPFSAPHLPLKGLLPYSRVPDRFHRKVTHGIVNFAAPGRFLFLQDGSSGLRVETAAQDVKVGDLLDVAGFVHTTSGIASLTEAVIQKLGKATPPSAERVKADELLLPEIANQVEPVVEMDHFGCLVKIRGRVKQVEGRYREGMWSLLVESDGVLFRAQLPGLIVTYQPPWQEGSEIDVTGVCEPEFAPRKPGTNSPLVSGFSLWLRSPADIEIVNDPPWWTARRLGLALLGALGVLALALGWNLALRRQLHKRSRMLEEMMLRHRDSELEFQGARQERQRLAHDLHDGLQQLMAGASYRVKAALNRLGDVPPPVEIQLNAALRALTRSQEGLREVLWGLQHMEEDSNDFTALLRHAVGTIDHWPEGGVVVSCEGQPYPLSRHVMGSLLLLMQETVGNAFKHGKARMVKVTLIYDDEFLEFQIEDNGGGFDPSRVPGPKEGHFGLESARLRMKWLGGNAEISSSPGAGTRVICHVPRSQAIAMEANHDEGEGKSTSPS